MHLTKKTAHNFTTILKTLLRYEDGREIPATEFLEAFATDIFNMLHEAGATEKELEKVSLLTKSEQIELIKSLI